jgi:hypothetical protein
MGVLHRWRMVMERRANGETGAGVEQREAVRAEFDPDRITDGDFDVRRESRFDHTVRGRDGDDLSGAEVFRPENFAPQPSAIVQADVFGANS